MTETMPPILLTGLPRSGTTWSSRAIAAAINGRIIHEPFNWKRYPERINYHMRYLAASPKDDSLGEGLLDILDQAQKPTIHDILVRNRPVVIKDVHICLAIAYVWQHLRPLVIMVMRHPCAIANSWRSLNLEARSRLALLLSQDLLVSEYLAPFENHMRSSENYYFEIGAYWGATYYTMSRIAAEYPEWQWVTHEWLCVDTQASYQKLLANLGISLNKKQLEQLDRFLDKHDRSRKPKEGPYSLARLSAQEPDKWRDELTAEQEQAVLDGAEPFGMLERFNSLTNVSRQGPNMSASK
jgi:hypothetical protein